MARLPRHPLQPVEHRGVAAEVVDRAHRQVWCALGQHAGEGVAGADFEPHRLCEMFDVMAELEAMCARLAARRITEDEIVGLRAAHQACEAARDADNPDAYYWLNEQFHRHIYMASHNGFLAEQAISLHRRLRPYRRLQLRVRNRMKVSYSEHQSIVDAIVAGDGERAAERIRGHIQVQGERFTDLVASVRQLSAAGT
ncbi:MAG: FCD domain-containing protein [Methyloversatilis sp.]|nr:FCD domain-containing protein [Methyloversatilis sp.]